MDVQKIHAALYMRVSRKKQAVRDSLPAQRTLLTDYAEHILHADSVEEFTDPGFTGTDTNRPELERMLSLCRCGLITHILVYRIDRLSRSMADFFRMYNDLKNLGVTLISVSEGIFSSAEMDMAMLYLTPFMAEVESSLISERVRTVFRRKMMKNEWLGGGLPYGLRLNKTDRIIEADPVKAGVVRDVFERYSTGESMGSITRGLNAEGIAPAGNGIWHQPSVRRMLTNPAYKGDCVWKAKNTGKTTVRKGFYPCIISEELWNAVQDRFAGRKALIHQTDTSELSFFRGLVRCGVCGGPMSMRSKVTGKREKKRQIYYHCPRADKCLCRNRIHIYEEALAGQVLPVIHALVSIQDCRSSIHTAGDLQEKLDRYTKNKGVEILNTRDLFYILESCGHIDYSPVKAPAIRIPLEGKEESFEKYRLKLASLRRNFLFSDDPLSEMDYIRAKKELDNLFRGTSRKLTTGNNNPQQGPDIDEKNTVLDLYVIRRLFDGETSPDYETFVKAGFDTARDFLKRILVSLTVEDRSLTEITFKNGIKVKLSNVPAEIRHKT